MADVTKTAKDAAYVLVGLGVLGFQKAQVRRQELRRQLEAQRGTFEAQLGDVRSQLGKLTTKVDLPPQARTIVKQAREAGEQLRGRLRPPFSSAA